MDCVYLATFLANVYENFVRCAEKAPHAKRNEAQKDRQGPQALLCLAEVLAWLKQATETHTDEEEAATTTTTTTTTTREDTVSVLGVLDFNSHTTKLRESCPKRFSAAVEKAVSMPEANSPRRMHLAP